MPHAYAVGFGHVQSSIFPFRATACDCHRCNQSLPLYFLSCFNAVGDCCCSTVLLTAEAANSMKGLTPASITCWHLLHGCTVSQEYQVKSGYHDMLLAKPKAEATAD